MGLSVSEIIIVAGVLLIVGILVDALRRMYLQRKGRLNIAIEKISFPDEEHNPELIGRTRIIGAESEDEYASDYDVGEELNDEQELADDKYEVNIGSLGDVDSHRSGSSGDAVPVLMNTVDEDVSQVDFVDELMVDQVLDQDLDENDKYSSKQIPEVRVDQTNASSNQGRSEKASYPVSAMEELIVINVVVKTGHLKMNGEDLLKIFTQSGLRYGDMDIFHRFENHDGTGTVEFSVANAVEPGTFQISDMSSIETPAISLFLSLPGPKKPIPSFELMVDIAKKVMKKFDAELKDEHHSVMTNQTIEHCRQRISEYERKKMMQREIS